MTASFHGTLDGYNNHRCRCPECRAAHARWQADYRAAQAEKGRCLECTEPAELGHRRCARHMADARDTWARMKRREEMTHA